MNPETIITNLVTNSIGFAAFIFMLVIYRKDISIFKDSMFNLQTKTLDTINSLSNSINELNIRLKGEK